MVEALSYYHLYSMAKPRAGLHLSARIARSWADADQETDCSLAEPPVEVQALARKVEEDGGAVLSTYREPLGAATSCSSSRCRSTRSHVCRSTRSRVADRHRVRVADRHGASNTVSTRRERASREALGARHGYDPATLGPHHPRAPLRRRLHAEWASPFERAPEARLQRRDRPARPRARASRVRVRVRVPRAAHPWLCVRSALAARRWRVPPVLRKVDTWVDAALSRAAEERKKRAELVLELDDWTTRSPKPWQSSRSAVSRVPAPRALVVARVNPLRFRKAICRAPTTSSPERPGGRRTQGRPH